jgi:hypothetical protein
MVAEGDKVAVFNSIQGIHLGKFKTFEAKGNVIDSSAFQLYRI